MSLSWPGTYRINIFNVFQKDRSQPIRAESPRSLYEDSVARV